MNIQIALNAAGGLALFLLAMHMMTEGLRTFGGRQLKHVLSAWTSSPAKGVLVGFTITGVIQSSGAVIVAAMGFVNAAMLSLRQGIGLIFGANIGTTTTAWLVTLIGFGFKIELLALPILTVGVVLRLMLTGKRIKGLGEALAGFGLFFLGLAILKDAFGGLAGTYTATVAGNGGGWGAFLILGFVATLLTQSSSASIALVITAALGGVIGLEAAAVTVIGANVGSTSTAAFAALKATPAARRLALGHVIFNIVAGVFGLLMLPILLWSIGELQQLLNLDGSVAVTIAVFHTAVKTFGVCVMLPLVPLMANILDGVFRSAHEDLGKPKHLDAALASVPEVALSGVRQELLRLRELVAGVVLTATTGPDGRSAEEVQRQADSVRQLGEAINAYVGTLRMEVMPKDVEAELTQCLRIGRYLGEAARLTHYVDSMRRDALELQDPPTRAAIAQALARVTDCVVLARKADDQGELVGGSGGDDARVAALDRFSESYEQTKVSLLGAAVAHRITVEATDSLLAELSATRRAVEQLVKGDRLLRSPGRAATIEAEKDMEEVEHEERGNRADDLRVAPEEAPPSPRERHSER